MAKGGKRSKTALPNAYSKPRKGCPQPMGLTKLGASTNVTLFFIPLKKNKRLVEVWTKHNNPPPVSVGTNAAVPFMMMLSTSLIKKLV